MEALSANSGSEPNPEVSSPLKQKKYKRKGGPQKQVYREVARPLLITEGETGHINELALCSVSKTNTGVDESEKGSEPVVKKKKERPTNSGNSAVAAE